MPSIDPSLRTFIIGKACRLPGAANLDEFRDLLHAGRCSVTTVPDDRWNQQLYYHPKPGTQGKSYTFAAGVLRDIWGFDLSVFNMSPREALQMDPQQRIMLQVVWEAFEDARINPHALAGSRVGVYVGASTMDHGTLVGRDPSLADAYMMTGNTLSLIANRISHAFDLRGPSFVVDTACSSAMVAMDQARQALDNGDIDMAVVAGANILLNPAYFIGFSAARMLSPDGLCQAFSNNANGYVRSEGAVAIVLKRSQDVPHRATACLLDSDINADGFTSNVALPSEAGQYALLDRLYARAALSPDDLTFVEAHGTGTMVGDPIEAHALGRAVAQHRSAPLPIGSAKSNIGHLEPVSGLVGVLKALIAMEDRRLPATLHVAELNPHIDFDELNLHVVREPLDLPCSGTLRAGVSSFGFGGVNAHCILEDVPPRPKQPAPQRRTGERLFVTSAFCGPALRDLAETYADMDHDSDLADQVWAGRGLHAKRLAVLAQDAEGIKAGLQAYAAGRKHSGVVEVNAVGRDKKTLFVYSGNGSQYAGMCRLALSHDAIYRETLTQIADIISAEAGWSLLQTINSPTLAEDLKQAHVAQAIMFADQVAQTRSLQGRGVTASGILGHSGGEVAAAHIAGAMNLHDATRLVLARGETFRNLFGAGKMAALQASAKSAQELIDAFLADHGPMVLSIAAINSPDSVTLSGENAAVRGFTSWVKKQHRIACVILEITYPYHSALCDQNRHALLDGLQGLALGAPSLPFISGTHGAAWDAGVLDAAYWWDNLRQPVQFQRATEVALARGFGCFLEIGAQPVLTSYLNDTADALLKSVTVTHSLTRSEPEDANPISRAAARAVLAGCQLAPGAFFATPNARSDISLPRYPWQNQTLRVTATPLISQGMGIDDSFHTLLGSPVSTDRTVWCRDLDNALIPSLADHKVGDAVWLPATAFAEMAHAAATMASGGAAVEIHDIDISAPMVLSSGSGVEVRTRVDPSTHQVRIESRARLSHEPFREHMRARYVTVGAPETNSGERGPAPISDSQDVGQFTYESAARVNLNYGPAFQGLASLRADGDYLDVHLAPGTGLSPGARGLSFDPVRLDCVLHAIVHAIKGTEYERRLQALVPVRAAVLQVVQPAVPIASGRVRLRKIGVQSVLVDVTAFDAEGKTCVRLNGLRFRAVSLQQALDFDQHAFHVGAQPCLPLDKPLAIDAGQIDALLSDLIPESGRADDALALITAATHQAIWAAFRAACKADSIYSPRRPDATVETSLLSMLSSLSLATPMPETGDWQICETCEIPDAIDIAQALLEERPDLIGKLSVLIHLSAAVSDFIASDFTEGSFAEDLFGRDAVRSQSARAPHLDHALAMLCQHVAKLASPHHCARIGILGPELVSPLGAVQFGPAVEPLLLLRENESLSGQTTALRTIEHSSRVALDVLAVTAADIIHGTSALERIEVDLQPGGWLVVQCPKPDTLGLVINAMQQTPQPPVAGMSMLRQHVEALGLTIVLEHDLPEAVGGGALVICQRPTDPFQNKTSHASLPEGCDTWEALWTHVHGPHSKTETPHTALWPEDTGRPVLILADRSSEHALRDRILALRDDLACCAQAERAAIVILRGGARYHGGKPPDPAQHALWAMLRTVQNEYTHLPLRILDPGDSGPRNAMLALEQLETDAASETEVVLDNGIALGLRVRQGIRDTRATPPAHAIGRRLTQPANNRLDSLGWSTVHRTPPAEGEVEIEVLATGLNYRDVMWAMGLLPEEALETGFAGPTLGLECAGRIVRVGPMVTDLQPGDMVLAFGTACFSSHITAAAHWVTKLPDTVSPAEAATLPVAYFTAHYALDTLGRLRKEETVLIHGGAGGVGLAAIAVAQRIGAKIIATAGSPVKRSLLRALGVEHVLSSRSMAFAQQVKEITEGRGVDVVLNSLAGSAMETSLGLLRPYGRFLELGKQDYYANTAVGMRSLKNNISYFGIDIDSLLADRPDLAKSTLADVMACVANEDYPPLPHTRLDGDAVVDAFRLMQRSGHIGKIVVTPPQTSKADQRPTTPGRTEAYIPDPDGWHVIAGGLGGIGLALAETLSVQGATRFALLSRSGTPSPEGAATIDKMRRAGADVRVLACDICDASAISDQFTNLRLHAPIKAVYHSAMVLEDRLLKDVDADTLTRSLSVKTDGLAILDAQTQGDHLDAFVAFTSLATLIGNYGQGAYVAANAYQEALIEARVARGQPGLAIALGAVSDAGYVTRDTALAGMLDSMSGRVKFPIASALNGLSRLLARPDLGPCVTVTPMNWAQTATALKILQTPTQEVLRRLGLASGSRQDYGTLRADLEALPQAKAMKKAIAFLKEEIAKILRVSESDLSPTRPLAEYGMDSLMGVELGLAVQQSLGDDLPMISLGDNLTIAGLARSFVTHIQAGPQDATDTGSDTQSAMLKSLGQVHAKRPDTSEAAE